MKFQDLVKLYGRKKEQYGNNAFRHASELLREAKELHRKDWLRGDFINLCQAIAKVATNLEICAMPSFKG